MAKREKKEVGKSIWENVLNALPAEQREALKPYVDNEVVLNTLGEHGLMREDYSRMSDEARAEAEAAQKLYNDNLTWRTERIQEHAEGVKALGILEKMKAAGVDVNTLANAGGTGGTNNQQQQQQAPSGMTKEELEKALRNTESQGLSVMTTLTNLSMNHLKEFGEVIDANTIVAEAQKKGTNLATAYNDMVAEKRENIRKADVAAQIEKARKEGIEAGIAKASAPPYPTGNGGAPDGRVTTLSGLKADDATKANFTVAGAVQAFQKLRSSNTN